MSRTVNTITTNQWANIAKRAMRMARVDVLVDVVEAWFSSQGDADPDYDAERTTSASDGPILRMMFAAKRRIAVRAPRVALATLRLGLNNPQLVEESVFRRGVGEQVWWSAAHTLLLAKENNQDPWTWTVGTRKWAIQKNPHIFFRKNFSLPY